MLPEGLLWRHLRTRPGGFISRRQHPAGCYILDFYCQEAALAIEVDGVSHDMGDKPERDAVRDEWLRLQGVRTLRFAAKAVLEEFEAVSWRLSPPALRGPLHRASRGSPPRKGRGGIASTCLPRSLSGIA
jgi:very-short-patch-repair endonuclease